MAHQDTIIEDLTAGRLDAALSPAVAVTYGFLNKPQGKDFTLPRPEVRDDKLFSVGSSFGVRKGDDKTKALLDQGLAKIVADGTWDKIRVKYFGDLGYRGASGIRREIMAFTPPEYDQLMPVMDDLLLAFSQLHRLSGSEDAERSATLLVDQLQSHGLNARIEHIPLLLSDPLSGRLALPEFPEWHCRAKTRSFSAHCPQGVSAALFYDADSTRARSDREWQRWAEQVRGKIVIADQGFEDSFSAWMRRRPLGWCISGDRPKTRCTKRRWVDWGTPTPDDQQRYPRLPVISINYHDGQNLLGLCNLVTTPVHAVLSTEVQRQVKTCSLPLVEIAGQSPEFVLLFTL